MASAASISALKPRPAHIPSALTIDFDMTAERAANTGGQDEIAALFAEKGPVLWTPHGGGLWIACSYDAVTEMARRTDLFSSDPRQHPETPDSPRLLPINLDPPDHSAIRAPLAAALSPTIINAMREQIRQQAREILDAFADSGEAEMVQQYTEKLPVIIILRLMGLPVDIIGECRTLMKRLLNAEVRHERDAIIEQIGEICAPAVREQMERPDSRNVIGRIILTGINGRRPTYDEALGYCQMIFTAGLDTVINSLSFGIWHLARDQELQARLRANYKLIPQAIEEFLRRYPIVQNYRVVTRDCDFFGAPLRQNDYIWFSTASNLDSAAFSEPREIRLGRKERPHQAFLSGPHRCAGFNLARIEMTIAYEELFDAIPTFRLDPSRTVKPARGVTFGLEELHLKW